MTEATMTERQIQISDRCDRCGARAGVKVIGVNGELFFCSHHYNEHAKALEKYAYDIIDERD